MAMEKLWIELPDVDAPAEILEWLLDRNSAEEADAAGLDQKGLQIVAHTLARRGLTSLEQVRPFLDPGEYQPCSPYELPGMQVAVQRLQQAIQAGETILVWGDFDVDGQTSTSLLVSVLRQLGAKVRYHIPVREHELHGVNIPVLSTLLEDQSQEPISLVLTCDTGISAVAAIAYANQQGVQVLVTDHHELPPELPDALAMVNPNFLAEDHPLHSLPGVGVAYKLAEALFQTAERGEQVEQFLDLAALGCVADVAQLRGETRYLVQRGLKQLAQRHRTGLRLMMEAAEVPLGDINEEVIGFTLAPRLNALGRLGDANPVVEFLIGEDEDLARVFVARLDALNARRQLLTSQTLQGALAQIEREPELLEDPILVLSHPAWPAGVIGIVASRLVEQFGKPAILLAAPPGEAARGSARSVEGFDITAALRWVQANTSAQPNTHLTEQSKDVATGANSEPTGIFYGFGGHRMAAGMSLPAERIPELRQRLRQAAQLQELPQPTLQVDAFLDFSELSFDLAAQLERLAPFGAGNPHLVLASRNLRVQRSTRIGRGQEHLKIILKDENDLEREVLWWQSADLAASLDLEAHPIDLAYQLRTTSYQGKRQLQLTWVDYRTTPLADLGERLTQRVVVDRRNAAHPQPLLAKILEDQPHALIWAEAEALSAIRKRFPQAKLADRYQAEEAPVLIIWTPPCCRSDLLQVLSAVQPAEVHLFNIAPESVQLEPFLQRLAGLVKYALRTQQGRVNLPQLAAATAQSMLTVRLGLDWLMAKGYLSIVEDEGEELVIASKREEKSGAAGLTRFEEQVSQVAFIEELQPSAHSLSLQISALLKEAAAFRAYYGRADLSKSIGCDLLQ